MKTALIGCGAISGAHLRGLSAVDTTVAALCDIDAGKAEKRKAEFGLSSTVYTDWREMIDRERPDVVHVCTPHYLHVPMSVYALSRGINVLCEKPMAISAEGLDEIAAAVRTSGARFGVCQQNRFEPNMKKLKEIVLSEGFAAAFASVVWKRDADYYAGGDWRGRRETEGGGVLINQALHTLDLMQWIFGMPEYVTANVSNDHLKGVIDVEDTAEAVFELPDGRKFNFFATTSCYADLPIQIRAKLPDKRVINAETKLLTLGDEIIKTETVAATEKKAVWGGCHRLLVADFYDCLKTGRRFAVDQDEAAKVVRMILSVYASQGERIRLI